MLHFPRMALGWFGCLVGTAELAWVECVFSALVDIQLGVYVYTWQLGKVFSFWELDHPCRLSKFS